MLKFVDKHWSGLNGGYRAPFDPRPLLSKLRAGKETTATWEALWEGLHHQGDVGEASYAATPHLIRLHRQHDRADWNTYALVAIIELARTGSKNPEIPKYLEKDYFQSIQELAKLGAREIWKVKDPEIIRAVLSVIALAKGARTHARFLIRYSSEELNDIERLANSNSDQT